jgi:hypothetical protein
VNIVQNNVYLRPMVEPFDIGLLNFHSQTQRSILVTFIFIHKIRRPWELLIFFEENLTMKKVYIFIFFKMKIGFL